jgi:hypothetical protein
LPPYFLINPFLLDQLIELAKTALVVGSAGFALYRFVRSWLLPQILGVPDPAEERLQRLEDQVARVSESSRAVAEGLAQTLGTVTEQNEQINRTLLLLQSQQQGGGRSTDLNMQIPINNFTQNLCSHRTAGARSGRAGNSEVFAAQP